MALLVLVRGVPGSGKTTLARKYIAKSSEDFLHLEADMFFEKEGEYKFDPSLLKEAHSWCQSEAKKRLESGGSLIVSNTFTRVWEMEAYLDLARELGVKYVVLRAVGEYPNIHNVPVEVVEQMKERFEDLKEEVIVQSMPTNTGKEI